jgi:hypothetical protein
MADTKISALTASTTPLAGTEVLPIVQSGATKQVSVANLTAGRAVSASSVAVTGSSAPANGLYLPAANSVALATNSTNAVYVNASQQVFLGGSTAVTNEKLNITSTNAFPIWSQTSAVGGSIFTRTGAVGSANNVFISAGNSYNYGVIGTVSATGAANGDVFGLGYAASAGAAFANCLTWNSQGNVAVIGALSKGSGSFRIDHPLPTLTDTHQLVHSFIEGPQADLIYRGKVNLVNGKATVNIDTASKMTEGTFAALCREIQCFTTNESDWVHVRGSVSGNILTIEAQDQTATSSISWMVIGERQDKHMMETSWTDENGKVIVEPLKSQLNKIENEELASENQSYWK